MSVLFLHVSDICVYVVVLTIPGISCYVAVYLINELNDFTARVCIKL